MADIVERLRDGCGCNYPETTCMAESECADAFAAADEIERLRAEVKKCAMDALLATDGNLMLAENNQRLRAALADPATVHINMLTGAIAKPTLAQIIHIYGADALRAALEGK